MDGTTLWRTTRTGVELKSVTMIRQQVTCALLYTPTPLPASTLPDLRKKDLTQAASPWAWMGQVISHPEAQREGQNTVVMMTQLTAGL